MRSYLQNHPTAFDPDEVDILASALDDAWKTIKASGARLDGDARAVRDALAKHIVEAAQRGELNKRKLCEGAVAHFATMNLPTRPHSEK
jgi:hypothetical protein